MKPETERLPIAGWPGTNHSLICAKQCGILPSFTTSEGHLLRALSEAAGSDQTVELSYRRMLDSLIFAIARKVRTEMEAGLTTVTDPLEIATALVLMNERYLVEKLGRRPQAKTKIVADTLTAIWLRVLYGIAQ